MAEEWVQKFETLQLHAGYVLLVVISDGDPEGHLLIREYKQTGARSCY